MCKDRGKLMYSPGISACDDLEGWDGGGLWLRLRALDAGGLHLIPGQGTRSHMLQQRVCMPQLNRVPQLRTSWSQIGFPGRLDGKESICNIAK